MSIELPKDAEGREIPLDTVALFNRVGNVYSIVRWTFTTDFDLSDGWSNKWRAITDLIDRPTCLDLVDHKQDPFIPGKRMVDGYFHCSDCG